MKFFNKGIASLIPSTIIVLSLLLASCEKDTYEPPVPEPDDTEEPSEPKDDPDLDENPDVPGFAIGDLKYVINTNSSDECYVSGMARKGIVNHLIIPNEVTIGDKIYRVTEIGENAKISAISVVTSDNLEIIADYAFSTDLQQLIVGTNVRKVSSDAWNNITQVGTEYYQGYQIMPKEKVSKIIWLPNTPPKGLSAKLGGKHNYTSVSYDDILKDKVTQIAELTSLFWVDGILYALESPADRTCIAIGCDYNTKENLTLKSEVINKGLTLTITGYGPYVFANNLNLKHVSTDKVENILEGSFIYCSNIQSIELGDNLKFIGNKAFYDCWNIQKLEIGPNTTNIMEIAFGGCYGIKEFILNGGDESEEMTVGSTPLLPSSNLESVTLHRDIKSNRKVGNGSGHYEPEGNVFESMKNLKKVTMIGNCTTVYNNEFKNCTNLSEVELGDKITTIGKFAFSGCTAMKSFVVGKSVNEIKENAFSDCTGLTDFTTEALRPPYCRSQALQDIDKWKCKLHVPDESIELYQNASQWKDFLFIE